MFAGFLVLVLGPRHVVVDLVAGVPCFTSSISAAAAVSAVSGCNGRRDASTASSELKMADILRKSCRITCSEYRCWASVWLTHLIFLCHLNGELALVRSRLLSPSLSLSPRVSESQAGWLAGSGCAWEVQARPGGECVFNGASLQPLLEVLDARLHN
jgi:hypothetical protein